MEILQVLFGGLLLVVCLPIAGIVSLVTFLFNMTDKHVLTKTLGSGIMTLLVLWIGYFWWVFG